MKKTYNTLQGLIFASSILLISGLSLDEYNSYRQSLEKSWVTGEQTSAYEKHYDEKLPLKKLGVNVWAAIEYLLFNEGRQGVVVGQQGWLYTSAEFKTYLPAEDNTEFNLQQIKLASTILSQRNIDLVVAVVPAKARIYPEYLGDRKPGRAGSKRYRVFTEWLQTEGVHWTGFNEAMLAAKQEQQIYLRTDTHWTPNGAKIAAMHLSNYIGSLDRSYLKDSGTFFTRVTASRPHEGDLMKFIPIRDYFHWIGPQPETIEPQLTEKSTSEPLTTADAQNALLFSQETEFEITLVGTSYSANELWNFHGALQHYLGQDILNYAKEGRGPIEPMQNYLASDDFKDTPPRLVIWEFPERYLPIKSNKPISDLSVSKIDQLSHIN